MGCSEPEISWQVDSGVAIFAGIRNRGQIIRVDPGAAALMERFREWVLSILVQVLGEEPVMEVGLGIFDEHTNGVNWGEGGLKAQGNLGGRYKNQQFLGVGD